MTTREIRALAEKAYWDEDDGRRCMAAWRESGLSRAAFARESGIGAHRLRYWSQRLESEPVAALVPVEVVGDLHEVPEGEAFEVAVGGGRVVRVPAAFDEAALVRLVRALERA